LSEGLVVAKTQPGSIAAQIGVEPGDRLLALNGNPVDDWLDYRFYSTDEQLTVTLGKKSGERWLLDIEKDYDEDLGLVFAEPLATLHRCQNRCLFCFVDQMPPGLRSSLYVKDDDYRLSFMEGNFVTLTNVGERELERIADQKLSPLYISVHTTNPALRRRMLGHPRAGNIMAQLRFLHDAGIEMHTQVVLCPGLNDGAELRRTVRDLAGLWPAVRSLAVVPVGRTRFREGLYPLRGFTPAESRGLVEEITRQQAQYVQELGSAFIHLADEFYLTAGQEVPPAAAYEGFPQLENGVGLARLFLDEWSAVRDKLPEGVPPRRVTVVTGRLGAQLLAPVAEHLNRIRGLHLDLAVVENDFFGRTVTVAGLLTGTDIRKQLRGKMLGDLVVVPQSALRDGHLFLDDTTLPELQNALRVPVVAASGPEELVHYALGDQKGTPLP
jgi:putative radical SAM enzyme (TIGR03279 family)